MYKLLRSILFLFDPEKIHHFAVCYLKFLFKIPIISNIIKSHQEINDKRLEREVFGLKFKNPVGLAAGFDKDAKLFNELSNLGFRLVEDSGIINRMGFNNEGVEAAVERLKKNKGVLIGGNIGKNKITPNEEANKDYLICFNALYHYVDYFVVNVSSPNTPNLRALQEKEPLTNLLNTLQNENAKYSKQKPILLKIAPDLSDEQLLDIIDIVKETKISGVIATNTTLSRDNLKSPNKNETGGLSGKPLTKRSTEVIRFLHQKSNGNFPIIGVGGIHSAEDALEKLNAGASLIQLFTGFIYEGPQLIKQINKKILERTLKNE